MLAQLSMSICVQLETIRALCNVMILYRWQGEGIFHFCLFFSILLLHLGSMGDASKAYAHSFLMQWASKMIVSLECPFTALSINV